jgi:2-polyprenyl-6-methoxyphenol hydroxylase-like FAD-dependent oxidoreductase
MSGLLAARALSDHFPKVTIIERDALPDEAASRRGVPQGEHIHVLLARGGQVLDELFPGLVDELTGQGVPLADMMTQTRFVFSGHEFARGNCESQLIQASRPLLEHTVRSRVSQLPGVEIVDRCEATGLIVSDGAVVGAKITHLGDEPREESLDAELVVDAMGRSGRMKTWLTELGYDAPAEDRVKCDVTYVSRTFRMPADALGPDRFVFVGAEAERPSLFGIVNVEGDRWMATNAGMAGIRPPSDEAGWLAFVETMPIPDVAKALADAEPLNDFVTHRFPASTWRRYDRLGRLPAGLLAFGDAICSFNPVYGQGMTVASLEAQALRECLGKGTTDLPRRFFKSAAKVIGAPWQLAGGGDLAIPAIEGDRPLPVRLINRYVARIHAACAAHPKIAATFIRVAGFLDAPSAIFSPGFMARVLSTPRRK